MLLDDVRDVSYGGDSGRPIEQNKIDGNKKNKIGMQKLPQPAYRVPKKGEKGKRRDG